MWNTWGVRGCDVKVQLWKRLTRHHDVSCCPPSLVPRSLSGWSIAQAAHCTQLHCVVGPAPKKQQNNNNNYYYFILFFKIYLKNIYWKCVNVWFAHTMSTWHGTLIALHVDFFCLFCTPKYPFVQFFLSPLLFLILFIFLAKQPLLTSFHVICIPLLTRFCHIPFVHWPLCRNSAQK